MLDFSVRELNASCALYIKQDSHYHHEYTV